MTTTINASTSSGIVATADGSGIIKVQSNGVTTNALAWINYNGASQIIRSSYNVSSVTRNGTGDYTINFTNTLADANYCAGAMGAVDESGGSALISNVSISRTSGQTASSFRVQTYYWASSSNSQADFSKVFVCIFGN